MNLKAGVQTIRNAKLFINPKVPRGAAVQFSVRSFRWLLPVLLILSISTQVAAQNTGQSLAELREAAKQGYARAQYNLGVMYAHGNGVPKDEAEAVRWYRRAAEQEYAYAQSDLGVMYATGRGVPKDEAEAVRWYRKAAEQGYAQAQYNLGLMYANGSGVPTDEAEAVRWYRKAAE